MVDAASYHYPWLPVRLVLKDRFLSDQYIKNVTAPILILHGSRDTIVPMSLGRRLFEAAPAKSRTGIAKTFVELPEAGHNDVLSVEQKRMETGISEFIDKLKRAKY